MARAFKVISIFFGIYLCHSASEASAHSSGRAGPKLLNQQQLSNVGPCTALQAENDYLDFTPLVFAVPPVFQLQLPSTANIEADGDSNRRGAREFFIRTGLSPPILSA